MKVRAICPGCGQTGTLDQFVDEADAKTYCKLVGELQPAIARALFDYLRLFSPPKRALSWSRALRLTQEIHAAIEKGSVERRGRIWAAPMPVWEPALQKVIAKKHTLTLPLKDNAFLFEILAGEANSSEARAEADREKARRNRAPGNDTPEHRQKNPAPAHEPFTGKAPSGAAGSKSAPIPGGSLKALVNNQVELLRSRSHTDSNDEDAS